MRFGGLRCSAAVSALWCTAPRAQPPVPYHRHVSPLGSASPAVAGLRLTMGDGVPDGLGNSSRGLSTRSPPGAQNIHRAGHAGIQRLLQRCMGVRLQHAGHGLHFIQPVKRSPSSKSLTPSAATPTAHCPPTPLSSSTPSASPSLTTPRSPSKRSPSSWRPSPTRMIPPP
ncbi:hypothetical protein FB45DRAFT_899107 [Roridomyces roridus]|uniref:Uncharacterized protein n=1 Tax=Roridomyces roridus TaxID=1738132 RepID=A0AAD7CCJ0_9AGAR|nr:hypothetical protein FB45DRAFT_934150 [Roridomyces roridus]KAJ7644982.1 hypothetical protein FB45DRAFT_899107 [Roridomyces roridus]